MNLEIIFFRIALAAGLTGLLLSAAYAFHSHQQARSWEDTVRLNKDQLSRCADSADDYHCILPVEALQENYRASVRIRYWHERQTTLLLHLAWLIPCLSLLSFYSLRWLILGRLRPIWPGS